MRNLFLLILNLLLTIQFLDAQVDKSNYALLWEITGNNLEQPSYLFGTMHIRDERAAEFPDSLLIALENVDAYAMEIHPDSMMKVVMDLFFPSSSTSLKEQLSPSAYERLNEAVLRKTGQPLDSLDNQDPSFIEYLLTDFDEPEYTKKKAQMVDLYLYKEAWLMDKATYGLEELRDYENVTDQFFQMFEKDTYQSGSDEQEIVEKYFEKMLQFYQSGDIYALQEWLEAQFVDADYDAAMLDTRNKKMVAQMQVQMQNQSVFCAVGTAHLLGENGMLDLLKEEGYTLRKVQATFDGYQLKDRSENQFTKWISTQNEQFGYSIKSPNEFYSVNELMEEVNPNFDMKMGMDMMDMNAYLICGIALPKEQINRKKLENLQTFLEDFGDDEERILLDKKNIKHQGIKGGEFKFKEGTDSYSIWRVFVHNNMVYLLGVYREDDDLDLPSANFFFNSLNFSIPTLRRSASKQYESKDGAYYITMPPNLKYRRIVKKQELETGEIRDVVAHSYLSSDPSTGNYYLIQHNFMGAGIAIEKEQETLDLSLTGVTQKWGDPIEPAKNITYKGMNGREAIYELEDQILKARIFIRGNRIYVLLTGLPKPNKLDETVDNFFNSFKLKKNLSMPLSTQSLDKIGLTIDLPTPPQEAFLPSLADEEYPQLNEWEYASIDTLNGNGYIVSSYMFPIYYQVENIELYLDSYAKNLSENKEISLFVDTTFQGRRAWYIETSYEKGVNHSLVFFNGYHVIEASLYNPEQSSVEEAWQLFNTIKIEKDYPKDYFTSDRSESLLENIQSRDSTTRTEAKIGIDRYEMSTANLPSIYKILETNYPFDTIHSSTIHDLMLQELLYTNDENTVSFLKKLFQKRAANQDTQTNILATLSGLKTEAAYALFFDLAQDYKKEKFEGYLYDDIFSSMRDTATLTANYYNEILALRENKALQYYSYNLILNLLRNDVFPARIVEKDRTLFLRDARQLVQEYGLLEVKDSLPKMEKYWHLDALHVIFGELSADVETDTYLTNLLKLPDAELVSTIIDALLMHQQTVPDYAFETVAEDSYYWKILLKNLKYEENLDKIPAALFTQEKTVKAHVYKYLEDEYDELNSFEILEKRTYTYDGKELSLYLFTFNIDGYEDTYLGVCSQPLAIEEINVNPQLFDYSGAAYTSENKETIYRELIESWLSE